VRQAFRARSWSAGFTHLHFARFAAIVLFTAVLFGLINTRAYAATPSHGCAPLAPPPIPGTVSTAPATPGIVLVNEILTNPDSTWNCSENGTFSVMSDAWVEFYNPQNEALNLYAAHSYLDFGPNTYRFYLPFGAAIAPHGYLVVFPNTASGTLIAGNNLRLMFLSTVIDQVSIPALPLDQSYARVPDGSSNWQITNNPTIDTSNLASIPTITPTATAPVTTGTTTSTSGTGPGGYGYPPTTTTPVVISGTQPAWSALNLPASTPGTQDAQTNPTPLATTPTLIQPSTPPSSTPSSDVPRRIMLTVMILVLVGALFWCWKVYSSA
jgi:hypothetical protein